MKRFATIILLLLAATGRAAEKASLTPEEQKWVAANPVLNLSVDAGNPPMNYRNEEGVMSGISIEHLRLLEKKIGVRFEFEGSTWPIALEKAMKHEVDGVVNASIKQDRKPYLNFSKPYFINPMAILTHRDAPELNSISDLKGKQVAVIRDTTRETILRGQDGIEVVPIDQVLNGFKLVTEGKVFAFFEDMPVSQYHIEKYFFSNVKVGLLYYAGVMGESRLGLRNDDPLLLSVINKGIAAVTEAERQAIRKKWFTATIGVNVQRELGLTKSEREWLAAHPVIHVATDPNWAPIEFLDEDGTYRGISIDYLNYISQQLGVRFVVNAEHDSWEELMNASKRREVDMFSAIAPTARRREFLDFTTSYFSCPVAIFTSADVNYVAEMEELNHRKVGVASCYAVEEWLARDYPEISLVKVRKIAEGIEKLRQGEIFAFVGNLSTVGRYLQHEQITDVRFAGQTPYAYDLTMAVRDDWPVLTGILDKALMHMPNEEEERIHNKWVTVRHEQPTDYGPLLKAFAVFAVVLVLFLYWNRRLAREIRERRQAQEALQQAIHRAEEANAAKSAFLANMSHEIRTPMNAILGYAQLMQRDKSLTLPQAKALQAIDTSGEHLLALINDVLDMSRIEAGKSIREDVDFNLHSLLHSLRAVFDVRAQDKGLDFRVIVDESVPVFVRADQRKLRQSLFNLLANAMKFTETGFVELGARFEDGLLQVYVKDTGCGIAAEDQAGIFQPFQQGRMSREGTGLGLSITRAFIESMDGTLDLESKPGQGSTFRIVVPLETGSGEELISDEKRRIVGLAEGIEPPRILIAEDRPESAELLTDLLTTTGFVCRVATNGEEAVRLWESWKPQLIWMDIQMPVMNGHEAAAQIREIENEDNRPVIIALTASAFETEKAKIIEAGCDDFLTKPFREWDLFQMMKHHLDISYKLADAEAAAPMHKTPLSAQHLATLDPLQRERLADAVKSLDANRVLAVVEEIRPEDEELVGILKDLVENFEFDVILEALEHSPEAR